jgi:phospholipid/cholesterol/gamma-HCH transport system substrate-binding protein
MGEQQKNLLIGIFVIVACAAIVSIILFLKPSVGDGEKTLYVRFSNINKITVGTRVTYAGRPVGEVVAIDEIYQAREQPVDSLGRYYFYQLELKVDSSVQVYNTDEISLQTSGLLGEKSVAIIPKKPPKGVVPKLIKHQPIYANSVDPIENTFQQLGELADKMDITIDEITKWIQKNGPHVADSIKHFGDAMLTADIVMQKINQQQLVEEIKQSVVNFSNAIESVQRTIDELKQGEVFTNMTKVMNNLDSTTMSVAKITKDVAEGKGTIGKFVASDEMYLRVTALMTKIDTLMNDINHYGVLFNLNKGWQRLRTQRASQLNALQTPEGFKNYFENEVDQINMAMSRISMLLERAEESPEKEKIMQSGAFKSDFAELMREVDGLSDNLRLYNEQLMEASSSTCECY